ncbi:MAG: glycosyltransferase, partial [Verrucomicrobiota bacterium]
LTVVVPCYNEAQRLDAGPLLEFAVEGAGADILFVNDGSTDDTAGRLAEIAAARPDRVRVLSLELNGGKAEAVRRGMLDALDAGAVTVGYLDADLSTPPRELKRIGRALDRPGVEVAIGSRVALLGTDIELLGRMLAGGNGAAPVPLKAIVEVPLDTWHDIKGSKLTPVAMGRTLLELGRIGLDLAARRRAATR